MQAITAVAQKKMQCDISPHCDQTESYPKPSAFCRERVCVAEHAHPGSVLLERSRIVGKLRRTESALRMGHHYRDAPVGRGEARETALRAVRIVRIALGGVAAPVDVAESRLCGGIRLAVIPFSTAFTVRDGKKIGTHQGAHFYTIGQRKGLGIGGRKESLFILATDVKENVIYVGEGDSHPGLWRPALRIKPEEIHWVDPDCAMEIGQERTFQVRIRYRQPLQRATLCRREEGLYILFDEPQRGITAGQFAAWYAGDDLVGSGVIEQ